MKILLLTPVYNGESSVSTHIKNLLYYFNAKDILVINDGSIDGSKEIINLFNVKKIHLNKNWGKGFVLNYGLSIAKQNRYDAVLTIDSDLQHDYLLIPELIGQFKKTNDFLRQNT